MARDMDGILVDKGKSSGPVLNNHPVLDCSQGWGHRHRAGSIEECRHWEEPGLVADGLLAPAAVANHTLEVAAIVAGLADSVEGQDANEAQEAL